MAGHDRDADKGRDQSDRERVRRDNAERRARREGTERRADPERDDPRRDRGEGSLRGRIESIVPEIVKRTMISGLGALFMTEETIRQAVSDMPKDAVNFFVQQADSTKEQLFATIAKEVRDYLDETDLSAEMAKLLSRVTLDVRTKIRFVPEELPDGGHQLKPQVENEVAIKRKPK